MFELLNQNDKKEIHIAARAILENVGVRINSDKIYKLLIKEGARPDDNDKKRLYFDEDFVKKYFSMCPKEFILSDRKGEKKSIKSDSGQLFYTSNGVTYNRGTSKKVVEIGEQEFIDFIRVADKLDNIDGLVGTSLRQYPPDCRDYAGFKLMAEYSLKHLRPCIYTPSGAQAIIQMAESILSGSSLEDNMFFTLGYSIVSPLTWSETALELFDITKGHKIPMMINSEPMSGGTSPVTLAGSLALADAEVISGIVINQVIEPGRPCIYNIGFAHVMDMMTMIVLTGAPENALLQTAGSEMAKYHDMPCASWALSDSLMLDSQASFEKFMTLMSHMVSNVNFIWGIGNIETSKTISPEVALIDNEFIGCIKRIQRKIIVDKERIALDLIKEIGFSGSYIESEHTYKYFREEIRNSNLLNRIPRILWEEKGSKSIEEIAEEKVNKILAAKPNIYLSGKQRDDLEKIKQKWMNK